VCPESSVRGKEKVIFRFVDLDVNNLTVPVEDFEEGYVPHDNTLESFTSPLDSTSDNFAFDPGDILNGVSFRSSNISADDLLLEDGFYVTGFSSKTLIAAADATLPTAMVVDFSGSGVNAVGFDFYVFNHPDFITSAITYISIYGLGDVLLDTQTVMSSDVGPAFFGVSSDADKIMSIQILGDVPGYYEWEGIDNVAFPSAVPEPTTLALMGLGLAGIGFARKKRQA